MTPINTLLLIVLLYTPLDNPIEPDTIKKKQQLYGRFQFAGNLGLASAGVGTFFFKNKVSVDLNYGYLPKSDKRTSVSTLAIKPSYHFLYHKNQRFKWNCYQGISITYSITNNTYLDYPDYFPKGYYMTNALHFNPFLGLRLLPSAGRKPNSFSLFGELGTVDYKIWYALKNKVIKPSYIWNVCFGLIFPI